jgi:hypothetical protein
VHLLKERYRTERVYQEMKGELRLDHFETQFPRLASSRFGRTLLLGLRHRRADAAFPPRDRTAKCRSCGRARDLSATSSTPSRPSDLPSPVPSFPGCHAARSVTNR